MHQCTRSAGADAREQNTALRCSLPCPAENKKDVDMIHEFLLVKGVEAVAVHGSKDQEEREWAIQSFKAGGWAWAVQACAAGRQGGSLPERSVVGGPRQRSAAGEDGQWR